ncbi:MAG: diaminopimelate epimerase, partial [Thermoleophilia bacterium]|nr:diaminopimelate epimerase [Thermoleophilia bacterium]
AGVAHHMRLAKWQGLGNDYLIIEESALPSALTPETIGLLCDRHLGVGSDGILLHAAPSGGVPGAVARMRVFNPDASEPEMCGNGIRQFARYLAERGEVSGPEFVVETLAGPIKPRLLPDDTVRVDMGRARFRSDNVAPEAGDDVVDAALEGGGHRYHFTFVDVGNPHCVILVDDPTSFDVAGVGPVVERHPLFPNRVNVEFIKVEPDGSVRMRVWERGVGETQACGTGATAVGAACVRLGLTASPVLVHLLGGDLTIEVEPGQGAEAGAGDPAGAAAGRTGSASSGEPRVFMTGPAEKVFDCELSPALLSRLGWPAAHTS